MTHQRAAEIKAAIDEIYQIAKKHDVIVFGAVVNVEEAGRNSEKIPNYDADVIYFSRCLDEDSAFNLTDGIASFRPGDGSDRKAKIVKGLTILSAVKQAMDGEAKRAELSISMIEKKYGVASTHQGN